MQNDSYRKNLIAKVHIGKSQLKMDEETYRTFLMNAVNKTSCKAMSNTELNQVLDLMAQRGAKVWSNFWGNRPSPAKAKKPYLAKITALLAKHNLTPQYADAIGKKAFGIEFIDWLAVWQLKKVIQMLSVYDNKKKL
ncbi:protein of unknown function DUF1018 [Histophilus somni 2336]|uniref:gp16 family protein n=1 Tax=Histophilus somni TaxID=731 RepID=UPI000045D69F|nr:regulatory protein GemA [Histophilus somni]ACA32315.1 protein of unknown function DUF1018 [Histophilus somni 2336]